MTKKQILAGITLIPVLLILVFIFSMSAQPADVSGETSHGFVDIVIDLFVPDYDQMTPPEQEELYRGFDHLIRKTAHFTEFAALGFFTLLHLNCVSMAVREKTGKGLRYSRLIAGGFGVLTAVSDEVHQIFVDHRSCQITDILIDSCGVIAGILVLLLIESIIRAAAAKKSAKSKA